MHLTPNSPAAGGMNLLKIFAHPAYGGTALLRQLTLVELNNFYKNRCEIPLLTSGLLDVIYYF